jgi:organic hydroperoxide reductase OsmC/OhrA
MSEHRAAIRWKRSSSDFTYQSYNRAYDIDAGLPSPIAGSSAPESLGHADRLDPERALVTALSSCHMLTFLAIAARRRLTLGAYEDEAVGFLEKNEAGKLAITRVILRPRLSWGAGVSITDEEVVKLHHLSHQECFIANSVKTEVTVEPQA